MNMVSKFCRSINYLFHSKSHAQMCQLCWTQDTYDSMYSFCSKFMSKPSNCDHLFWWPPCVLMLTSSPDEAFVVFLTQPLLTRGVRILVHGSVKFDIVWVNRSTRHSLCILNRLLLLSERIQLALVVSRIGKQCFQNFLWKVGLFQPFVVIALSPSLLRNDVACLGEFVVFVTCAYVNMHVVMWHDTWHLLCARR